MIILAIFLIALIILGACKVIELYCEKIERDEIKKKEGESIDD